MGITLNGSATNNADWQTQFKFTDSVTDEVIDFTGATIKIQVEDKRCYRLLDLGTDSGEIVINDDGFLLTVDADRMKNICPGTYNMGGVYELNGETISLFTGTVNIIDGVARI